MSERETENVIENVNRLMQAHTNGAAAEPLSVNAKCKM